MRLHPRDVYLQVLVALNHAHYPELIEAYQDRFLTRLNPPTASHRQVCRSRRLGNSYWGHCSASLGPFRTRV